MMARGGRGRMTFRRVPISTVPPERKSIVERTPKDCLETKSIIAAATNFSPELVDIVMDLAEHWACSMTSIDFSKSGHGTYSIAGASAGENHLLLRTGPVGLTTWRPDDEKRWEDAAPPCTLEEEYTTEELVDVLQESPSDLSHPFRKVVFDIVSRDQGYTWEPDTQQTFRSSWTWFDAGIDRFDKAHTCSEQCPTPAESGEGSKRHAAPRTCAIRPVWPPIVEKAGNSYEYDHQLAAQPDHKIQCNRTASSQLEHHHVEWSWTDDIEPQSSQSEELEAMGRGSLTGDGKFIRDLKVGDMVTIWMRARFPGWSNIVQKVEVRVYWAV
ncbi:hypothetical protein F5Y17DRAFT_322100 [Xylariaceae sp. FL0594]|nr:hypothetical protein F5Y17DRAFT_322100 [Xylariaceae sp. FL0594]